MDVDDIPGFFLITYGDR